MSENQEEFKTIKEQLDKIIAVLEEIKSVGGRVNRPPPPPPPAGSRPPPPGCNGGPPPPPPGCNGGPPPPPPPPPPAFGKEETEEEEEARRKREEEREARRKREEEAREKANEGNKLMNELAKRVEARRKKVDGPETGELEKKEGVKGRNQCGGCGKRLL